MIASHSTACYCDLQWWSDFQRSIKWKVNQPLQRSRKHQAGEGAGATVLGSQRHWETEPAASQASGWVPTLWRSLQSLDWFCDVRWQSALANRIVARRVANRGSNDTTNNRVEIRHPCLVPINNSNGCDKQIIMHGITMGCFYEASIHLRTYSNASKVEDSSHAAVLIFQRGSSWFFLKAGPQWAV